MSRNVERLRNTYQCEVQRKFVYATMGVRTCFSTNTGSLYGKHSIANNAVAPKDICTIRRRTGYFVRQKERKRWEETLKREETILMNNVTIGRSSEKNIRRQ